MARANEHHAHCGAERRRGRGRIRVGHSGRMGLCRVEYRPFALFEMPCTRCSRRPSRPPAAPATSSIAARAISTC
jgi:hypothetical protein